MTLRGYDNALSIRRITKKDIDEMQEYMQGTEMKKRIPQNSNFRDYFGPLSNESGTGTEKCYILPGHVYLIEEVVGFIQLKGSDFFNVKVKQLQGKVSNKRCNVDEVKNLF